MKTLIIISFLIAVIAFAINSSYSVADTDNLAQARKLAKSLIIIDTHIDVPYRLNDHYEDISKATEKGDLDYPRAVEGGLNAPFMSIYIPADLEAKPEAIILANKLIDDIEKIIKQSPNKFMAACSSQDVEKSLVLNKIALPLGMENGAPIAGDFKNLEHFYKRGIRYVTLAHSKSNHISDSSYDENRQWFGLSEFGKKLVPEMNRLGVMIDISHVSDIAFYQVIESTKTPVIASHSSARHFTPDFERNMSDEMIIKLGENDGVIQINYGSTFLIKSARIAWDLFSEVEEKFITENSLDEEKDKDEIEAFKSQYKLKHPELWANISDVLDHIDHVVKLTNINHVGLGSDYDGVGDSLPNGLKDVSTYPALIQGLLDRGYDEVSIGKILGGNSLRVWKAVEKYATSQGTKLIHCSE
ncbi:MAG: membrane dipeptidase [Enterobacterales bacterium]|jgi:membrane dipeptidase